MGAGRQCRRENVVLPSGTRKYLTYRVLAGFLAAAPEPVARVAGIVVGGAMWVAQPGTRAVVGGHMDRVVGPGLSIRARQGLVRRAFLSYARYWVESARVSRYAPATIREKMVHVDGMEHLAAASAQGKGVIMALPHLGGWELGGAWLADCGYPMTAVAEVLDPPELFSFFVNERSKLGLTIVPLGEGSGREILRTLRSGGLVGLICDRDIVGNGVTVGFFGATTTLPGGPAALSMRTGAPVLPTAVYLGPDGGHYGVIAPPIAYERTGKMGEDIVGMTQAIATELEKLIRRAPEQWHVFQPNWPEGQAGR